MTCVSKEYDIEIKMVHEQWLQLKMLVLLGYNLKIVFSGGNQPLVEGDKNLLGESTGGNFFQVGGGRELGKPWWGFEDIEFTSVLKKEHVEIPRVN